MSDSSSSKAHKWALNDHILYECALARDEGLEWDDIKAEDASFKAESNPQTSRNATPSDLIYAWISHQQTKGDSVSKAAGSISGALKTGTQTLCALATILGLIISSAALNYSGEHAINVSAFFALFILLQILLTLSLATFFLLPTSLSGRILDAPIARFTAFVFERSLSWAHQFSSRVLDQEQRSQIAEISGIARIRLKVRSGLFKWIAFRSIQLPAVCLNLGALAGLLSAVVFSDRAFGWQTTLDVEPRSIFLIAEFIASPWFWLYGEGIGLPSIEQIEGSRIVLKEGIQSLDNENLAAWWRFLALGIICYGIIPRAIAALFGSLRLNNVCRHYDFQDAASQRLLNRLSSKPHLFASDVANQTPTESNAHPQANDEPSASQAHQDTTCLIDKTLLKSLNSESLKSALAELWNAPNEQLEILDYELPSIDQTLISLPTERQIGIVFESWMPPIKETERLIKTLRAAIPEKNLIRLVLVGLSTNSPNAVSLHSEPAHRKVWKTFARNLGDPYLLIDETYE